jgi:hypothetical protein
MYKTKVVITVLSEEELPSADLDFIADEITNGDYSGACRIEEVEKLTRRQMALALLEQNSDPDFLLGDDGWKYALDSGDEVTVDCGEPEVAGTVIISAIEYVEADSQECDAVRITTKDGEVIECLTAQLS